MLPLISIIVPVYNAERYLDKCIDSIIKQTYKNIEIILVDDGSKDSTPTICDEYALKDNRIKVIHKKNGGVSSARNVGLDIASGEYIGFVDSDDHISENMYEELFRNRIDESTVITLGAYQESESGVITLRRSFSDSTVSSEIFLNNIFRRFDGTAVWSRLFPRQVIGNSRFEVGKLNEEILFWMSMMPRIRYVRYISHIGYYYFQHSNSISHQFGKSIHDMIYNSLEVKKYVYSNFPSLSKVVESYVIYQHMNFLLCCPSNYDRKSDFIYAKVLKYTRKNMILGICNPNLSFKDKLKLLLVSCCPCLMSKMVEKRRKTHEKKEKCGA